MSIYYHFRRDHELSKKFKFLFQKKNYAVKVGVPQSQKDKEK